MRIGFKIYSGVFLIIASLVVNGFCQTQSLLIYKTGFEIEEGFNPQYTLIGQNGWTGEGSAWNGLTVDEIFFPGFGQQAYIGYSNITPVTTASVVWRPLNYQITSNYPVIKFSVIFQIKDSSNGHYDDFRWSVYNTNDQRLFSIDFDNETLNINYSLDTAGEFYSTGYSFFNYGLYRLTIAMNFPRNRWIAEINDVQVTPSLPMTTKGYALSLGDIDASWVLHDTNNPGNNYMIFDEFIVTAETIVNPPQLKITKTSTNSTELKLYGEPAVEYVIQTSTNLLQWTDFSTNTVLPSGAITFTNLPSGTDAFRFFRGKIKM